MPCPHILPPQRLPRSWHFPSGSVSLKSVPTFYIRRDCAGPEVCGVGAGKRWGEQDPLPGKHTSTCKNMSPSCEMCPGPREGKPPGNARMHRSPPFPLAGSLCCLWKVRASSEAMLHACAVGEKHAFQGWRGSRVRGPVISLLLPGCHPVLSGGQRSLPVKHITSRGSREWDGEEEAKA